MLCFFDSGVANMAGVDSAVIFEYIANKCKDVKYSVPVHLPVKNIIKDLPFYTERQARYSINRLVNLGLIEQNKDSDKSAAYTITKLGEGYLNDTKLDKVVSNGGLNISLTPKRKVITDIHKTNEFIKNCEKMMYKASFPETVQPKLMEYFRYLAEQGCLMPKRTISYQLAELKKLSAENMEIAIDHTISHGWKSLVYMVDDLLKNPNRYISVDAVKGEVFATGMVVNEEF